ncbi:MAG: hypothetical protein D6743_16355 [Calditrichaeota bacterium]|nr:MAG: hypothetical protein D6743_16355 [Calditrichota bacterium]
MDRFESFMKKSESLGGKQMWLKSDRIGGPTTLPAHSTSLKNGAASENEELFVKTKINSPIGKTSRSSIYCWKAVDREITETVNQIHQ